MERAFKFSCRWSGGAQFTAATARMIVSLPVGCALPAGLEAGELGAAQTEALIRGEMWRYARVEQIGDRSHALPGGKPASEFFRFQPAAVEPAAESVRRQNEYILGAVRRQIDA